MKRCLIPVLAIFAASCTEELPLAPTQDADLHYERDWRSDRHGIRVLTRNVYVGANVDVVLGAETPEEIPILALQAFRELLSTNFPERAMALAREIRRTRPHLIGLQEISTIRVQSPGDVLEGGIPAEDVLFDFLAILEHALAAQGERYSVVAKIQNADVEVPMLRVDENGVPVGLDDVRLTDYDVILARHGVKTTDAVAENYTAKLEIPGLAVIPRGFVAVTAHLGRRAYRFVNTHLEPAAPPLRLAQAQELNAFLAEETNPVILVGDLNTFAPEGDTYQFLLGAGYEDAWTNRPRRDDGLTCCHASDLTNTDVMFDRRIDFIMARPADARFHAPIVRVIGKRLRERTPSGLWPSDHAGVWGHLVFAGKRRTD